MMTPDDITRRPGESLAAWETRMTERYQQALKASQRPPWRLRRVRLDGEVE